jgi:hypothetical protein
MYNVHVLCGVQNMRCAKQKMYKNSLIKRDTENWSMYSFFSFSCGVRWWSSTRRKLERRILIRLVVLTEAVLLKTTDKKIWCDHLY